MRSTSRRGIRFHLFAIAAALAASVLASAAPAGAAEAGAPLPTGRYLFATLADDRLAVVDTASRTVVQTLAVPGLAEAPHPDLVADLHTPTLYLTAGPAIAIVDAADPAITGTLIDPAGSTFISIAASPDGALVYGLTEDQHVVVFDQASRTVLARVPTSGAPSIPMPRLLAASSTGVYASSGAVVDFIAVGDSDVTARIQLAGAPASIAVQAPGLNGLMPLYAVQLNPDSVVNIAVVDPDTHEIVGNPGNALPLSLQQPIVMSPDGTRVIGGTTSPARLQAFNARPGEEPGGSEALLPGAAGVPAITPDGQATYVPVRGTATVAELPGVVRAPSAELTLPANVLAIAVMDVTAEPEPSEPPSEAPPTTAPAAPSSTTGGAAGRPAPTLPSTGFEPSGPLALAVALILAGSVALRIRRRPSTAPARRS